MKKEKNSLRDKRIEMMVIYGIIIAIMAILNFVPNVGYINIIPIPNANAVTIIHLFVLVFAWVFGWKEATFAGLVFGVFCFANSFTNPAYELFRNPIVSIVPRLLFGFLSG